MTAIRVKRRKILLLEDDADSAIYLAECLPCYDILLALTIEEAVRKIFDKRNQPFSAFILDIKLPDGDGMKLSQNLSQVWPEVPIIIITGMSVEERDTVVIHKAGAEKVIRKPFSPDDIREALIDCIAPREAKEQLAPVRQATKEVKEALQDAKVAKSRESLHDSKVGSGEYSRKLGT